MIEAAERPVDRGIVEHVERGPLLPDSVESGFNFRRSVTASCYRLLSHRVAPSSESVGLLSAPFDVFEYGRPVRGECFEGGTGGLIDVEDGVIGQLSDLSYFDPASLRG